MNKKPRKINSLMMAGHRIKVRHVTEDELREEWGDWDEDQLVIRLLKSLVGKPAYVKWLKHEMRHAALSLGGVAYCTRYEEEATNRCLDNIYEPAWAKVKARL